MSCLRLNAIDLNRTESNKIGMRCRLETFLINGFATLSHFDPPVVVQMDGEQAADFTLSLTRSVLHFLGLWPNLIKSNERFSLLKVCILVSMILIFCSIPQTTKLFMVWGDLDKVVKILSLSSIPAILVMFKMIHIYAKKEKIKTLVTSIYQDWTSSKTENERKLMTFWAKKCRKVALMYIFLSQSTFFVYTTQQVYVIIIEVRRNLTDISRTTYLESYFPYNINKSPNFEISWLMQCISIQLGNIAFAGIDSFFAILVLHFCGQFKVLHQRVLSCMEETDGEFFKWKRKLGLIVLRHEHLINCIRTVENTFNIMFLAQVIGFTINLCIQGYVLILIIVEDHVGSNSLEFVFMILYIEYMVLNFYIYCYIGETFRKQSTAIEFAAYSCKWYNLRTVEAKFIMFLIHRARKTVDITAGKFCIFSLEFFTKVIKTSMGYLSMLLTVQKRNLY